MDQTNLEILSLEELEKLHEECTEDLKRFDTDFKLFRQAYPGRMTMFETMCNKSTKQDISEMPKMKDKNNATDKLILRFSEIFTGITITDIFITALENGKNNDDQYMQYNVTCSVEKINLKLIFDSNVEYTDYRFDNADKSLYEIKNLKVNILSPKYKLEFQQAVEYFCEKPMYLASLFLNLKMYNKLYSERRQVLKKFLTDNQEYLAISLENETGHYVMECKGKYVSTVFFVFVWGIVFDETKWFVRDSFIINVHEDEQLLEEVNPSLKKLCDKQIDLSEDDKLLLLSSVMDAVRAADTRLDGLSNESSISEVPRNDNTFM